jgi:transposase
MNANRKNYDKAFKENAVKLSYERNNTRDLSRELGINENILYRWRREYSEFKQASFGGKGVLRLTDEKKKIHELEKRAQEAEQKIEILKKTMSSISKSNL